MKFDITSIDKTKLLKTVYATSMITGGVGTAEYLVREARGENVDILTDEECESILYEFNASQSFGESYRILDYHNGKPIQLVFDKYRSGRIVVDSDSYDSRNGEYKFLEAMIAVFPLDEIKIINKSCSPHKMIEIKEHLRRPANEVLEYRNLLKSAVKKRDEFGFYWELQSV
jgi:hypothetical protein